MKMPQAKIPDIFDLEPAELDAIPIQTLLKIKYGLHYWESSANPRAYPGWMWTERRIEARLRLLNRIERYYRLAALRALKRAEQYETDSLPAWLREGLQPVFDVGLPVCLLLREGENYDALKAARTRACVARLAEHLLAHYRAVAASSGYSEAALRSAVIWRLSANGIGTCQVRPNLIEQEAGELTRLYAELDLSAKERRQRLEAARKRAHLQARVVRRAVQVREDRPAFPVVKVRDAQGRSVRIEVFLEAFSAGSRPNRVLDPVPEEWDEDTLEAAKWLAAETALDQE